MYTLQRRLEVTEHQIFQRELRRKYEYTETGTGTKPVPYDNHSNNLDEQISKCCKDLTDDQPCNLTNVTEVGRKPVPHHYHLQTAEKHIFKHYENQIDDESCNNTTQSEADYAWINSLRSFSRKKQRSPWISPAGDPPYMYGEDLYSIKVPNVPPPEVFTHPAHSDIRSYIGRPTICSQLNVLLTRKPTEVSRPLPSPVGGQLLQKPLNSKSPEAKPQKTEIRHHKQSSTGGQFRSSSKANRPPTSRGPKHVDRSMEVEVESIKNTPDPAERLREDTRPLEHAITDTEEILKLYDPHHLPRASEFLDLVGLFEEPHALLNNPDFSNFPKDVQNAVATCLPSQQLETNKNISRPESQAQDLYKSKEHQLCGSSAEDHQKSSYGQWSVGKEQARACSGPDPDLLRSHLLLASSYKVQSAASEVRKRSNELKTMVTNPLGYKKSCTGKSISDSRQEVSKTERPSIQMTKNSSIPGKTEEETEDAFFANSAFRSGSNEASLDLADPLSSTDLMDSPQALVHLEHSTAAEPYVGKLDGKPKVSPAISTKATTTATVPDRGPFFKQIICVVPEAYKVCKLHENEVKSSSATTIQKMKQSTKSSKPLNGPRPKKKVKKKVIIKREEPTLITKEDGYCIMGNLENSRSDGHYNLQKKASHRFNTECQKIYRQTGTEKPAKKNTNIGEKIPVIPEIIKKPLCSDGKQLRPRIRTYLQSYILKSGSELPIYDGYLQKYYLERLKDKMMKAHNEPEPEEVHIYKTEKVRGKKNYRSNMAKRKIVPGHPSSHTDAASSSMPPTRQDAIQKRPLKMWEDKTTDVRDVQKLGSLSRELDDVITPPDENFMNELNRRRLQLKSDEQDFAESREPFEELLTQYMELKNYIDTVFDNFTSQGVGAAVSNIQLDEAGTEIRNMEDKQIIRTEQQSRSSRGSRMLSPPYQDTLETNSLITNMKPDWNRSIPVTYGKPVMKRHGASSIERLGIAKRSSYIQTQESRNEVSFVGTEESCKKSTYIDHIQEPCQKGDSNHSRIDREVNYLNSGKPRTNSQIVISPTKRLGTLKRKSSSYTETSKKLTETQVSSKRSSYRQTQESRHKSDCGNRIISEDLASSAPTRAKVGRKFASGGRRRSNFSTPSSMKPERLKQTSSSYSQAQESWNKMYSIEREESQERSCDKKRKESCLENDPRIRNSLDPEEQKSQGPSAGVGERSLSISSRELKKNSDIIVSSIQSETLKQKSLGNTKTVQESQNEVSFTESDSEERITSENQFPSSPMLIGTSPRKDSHTAVSSMEQPEMLKKRSSNYTHIQSSWNEEFEETQDLWERSSSIEKQESHHESDSGSRAETHASSNPLHTGLVDSSSASTSQGEEVPALLNVNDPVLTSTISSNTAETTTGRSATTSACEVPKAFSEKSWSRRRSSLPESTPLPSDQSGIEGIKRRKSSGEREFQVTPPNTVKSWFLNPRISLSKIAPFLVSSRTTVNTAELCEKESSDLALTASSEIMQDLEKTSSNTIHSSICSESSIENGYSSSAEPKSKPCISSDIATTLISTENGIAETFMATLSSKPHKRSTEKMISEAKGSLLPSEIAESGNLIVPAISHPTERCQDDTTENVPSVGQPSEKTSSITHGKSFPRRMSLDHTESSKRITTDEDISSPRRKSFTKVSSLLDNGRKHSLRRASLVHQKSSCPTTKYDGGIILQDSSVLSHQGNSLSASESLLSTLALRTPSDFDNVTELKFGYSTTPSQPDSDSITTSASAPTGVTIPSISSKQDEKVGYTRPNLTSDVISSASTMYIPANGSVADGLAATMINHGACDGIKLQRENFTAKPQMNTKTRNFHLCIACIAAAQRPPKPPRYPREVDDDDKDTYLGQVLKRKLDPRPGDIMIVKERRRYPQGDKGYVSFYGTKENQNYNWNMGDFILRIGRFHGANKWIVGNSCKLYQHSHSKQWMLVGIVARPERTLPLVMREEEKVDTQSHSMVPRRGDFLVRLKSLEGPSQLEAWNIRTTINPSDILVRVYIGDVGLRCDSKEALEGQVELYIYDGQSTSWIFLGRDIRRFRYGHDNI